MRSGNWKIISNAAFAAIVPVVALLMAWVPPAMAAGVWTPEG